MIVKATTTDIQSMDEYVKQISHITKELVKISQNYMKNRQDKVVKDNGTVTEFIEGEYVLVSYPNRSPDKFTAPYKGPMRITRRIREDLFKVLDLTSMEEKTVHVERLRKFNGQWNDESARDIAARDQEEYSVESIVDHAGSLKNKRQMRFRIRWSGYDADEDSWLPFSSVRKLEALDNYVQAHPELKGL
jgi:hypothetical protein